MTKNTTAAAARAVRLGTDAGALWPALSCVVAIVPGLWLALDGLRGAAHAYTAIPFWDQWALVADYSRATREGLSWNLLFRQSNEHRILFGRIIGFADLQFLGGRNGLLYATTILCQVLLLGLLALVALRLRRERPATLLSLGVCAALIFSLGQWENLTWAFQAVFMMVAAAGAWSIYLFFRATTGARPSYSTLAGSVALLVVASYSMANGMIAGAASIGVGLLARVGWRPLAFQAAALTVIAVLYFHGYVAPAGPDAAPHAFGDPLGLLRFAATYMGSPARSYGPNVSAVVGGAGIVLSLVAALRVLLRRDRDPDRLALVGVMAFVIASALVTALGRLSFGPAQGLVSRYLTFGLIFWAVQVVYWASLVRFRGPWALVALAALLLLPMWPLHFLQAQSKRDIAERQAQIRLGVLALRAGADDPAALAGLNWSVPLMMAQVDMLKRRHLSIYAAEPRYRIGASLRAAPVVPMSPDRCLGSFDVIDHAPRGSAWRASGWAWDVQGGHPVRDILLVGGSGRIEGVGLGGGLRPDVSAAVAEVRSDESGWNAVIATPDAGPVSALGILDSGARCLLGQREWPR